MESKRCVISKINRDYGDNQTVITYSHINSGKKRHVIVDNEEYPQVDRLKVGDMVDVEGLKSKGYFVPTKINYNQVKSNG